VGKKSKDDEAIERLEKLNEKFQKELNIKAMQMNNKIIQYLRNKNGKTNSGKRGKNGKEN
jgi:flagellar basal body-associated protein FliL